MQLFKKYLPADCDIVLASDIHVGSLHTHYKGIEECLDHIAKPNTYCIILGDLAEAMTVNDYRFDPNTNDLKVPTVVSQYNKVVEIFERVKDKILYINDGNHDYKHASTINFVKDIVCEKLNVPYGTYSSKLSILDDNGSTRIKLYTTHGHGSMSSHADDPIRRKSNLRLSLKRKLMNLAGDCHLMAMGHTHKLITAHPISTLYMTDDGHSIVQHYMNTAYTEDTFIHPDHRYYVNTGSFLKSQILGCSGYAERFGYAPEPLGYAVIHIRGYKIDSVDTVRL